MHTFKTFVAEILDGAIKPKLIHENPKGGYKYELELPGNTITFTVAKVSNGYYIFYFQGDDENGKETFDKTGKGSEFKIFGACKWILAQLIDKHSPDLIDFEGEKDLHAEDPLERVRLYRKFINKYKPDNYDVIEKDTKETMYFQLKKKV